MTEITTKRISEILRLVFDLLWFEPQGLYASEIMRYIQASVPLTDFETGYYPFAPYSPRFEVIIRIGTIPLVRAGWLEKTKQGRWFITDTGREACARYNNAEEFFEESVRLFLEWRSSEKNRLAQLSTNSFNYALENAWEQIREYIDALELRELRALVGELLKALGCHITWTASGSDKNDLIDLICYMDPLGINSPRIAVHIANKNQVATIEGLMAFMESMQPQDVGIFISFGGITSSLKEYQLNQTDNQIRLIDLETFVNLWVENIDRIDQEYRNKFPLRPVYFLDFPEAT